MEQGVECGREHSQRRIHQVEGSGQGGCVPSAAAPESAVPVELGSPLCNRKDNGRRWAYRKMREFGNKSVDVMLVRRAPGTKTAFSSGYPHAPGAPPAPGAFLFAANRIVHPPFRISPNLGLYSLNVRRG